MKGFSSVQSSHPRQPVFVTVIEALEEEEKEVPESLSCHELLATDVVHTEIELWPAAGDTVYNPAKLFFHLKDILIIKNTCTKGV